MKQTIEYAGLSKSWPPVVHAGHTYSRLPFFLRQNWCQAGQEGIVHVCMGHARTVILSDYNFQQTDYFFIL